MDFFGVFDKMGKSLQNHDFLYATFLIFIDTKEDSEFENFERFFIATPKESKEKREDIMENNKVHFILLYLMCVFI